MVTLVRAVRSYGQNPATGETYPDVAPGKKR